MTARGKLPARIKDGERGFSSKRSRDEAAVLSIVERIFLSHSNSNLIITEIHAMRNVFDSLSSQRGLLPACDEAMHSQLVHLPGTPVSASHDSDVSFPVPLSAAGHTSCTKTIHAATVRFARSTIE